jgi:hypothetical protein
MAGLFGMTPEEQRALDMAEGQNLMSAGQQLGGGMLMYAPSMGRMQSESIMGALQGMGVSTPSQRKEEQVKAALQGLDYNNPASMMEAARKLLDLGMTAEAQQLVKAAQDAQTALLTKQEKEAGISSKLAQANYYGAQSQKALTGGTDNTLTETELYAKWAEEGGHEYAVNKLRELRATKPFAPQQAPKLNVSQGFNEFLAAKGMTVEQFMQQPEETRVGMTSAYEKSPFFKDPVKGAGGGTTKEIQNAQRKAMLELKETEGTLTPLEANELKDYRTGKMTTVGETAVNKNVEAYDAVNKAMFGLDAAVDSMNRLMTSNVKWKSGTLRGMAEYLKAIAGTEDEATIANLRTEAAQIEKQLAALPPGPATDKDMAVAARVRLGQYANPQAMLVDLKYMQEAAKRVKEGVLFKDQYLNTHKNLDGFPTAYEQRFGNKQNVKSGVTSTGVPFRIKE